MLVFSLGSDWAEKLFQDVFSASEISTDVVENPGLVEGDIVLDVKNEGQLFENGVVVRLAEGKEQTGRDTTVITRKEQKTLSLPVVIRIFNRQVPLSEIDSIGETSEILISNDGQFEVELLVNGEPVGKGLLKKEEDSFRLKITELMI